MCMVSVIMQDAKDNFPLHLWDQAKYDWFKEIINRTKKLDEMMDQKDCVDPEKEKYMQEIEQRLSNLEKRIKAEN